MTTSQELKNIALNLLFESKSNPRTTFDASKTMELAESIKQHGVIHAILVRPRGQRYEIVCGHRRVRASKEAGMKDIPALIKEIPDQEVRELQLIENFQRENVHAMEEAVAVFAAIKTGKYSVHDLAIKVGKSEKYIGTRLQLNELIEPLRQVFFEDKLNLSQALSLSGLLKEDQDEFFKENGAKAENFSVETWRISSFIRSCQGRLDEAPFDINDATLLPKMGSCTDCHFNSKNANLMFSDENAKDACNNSKCFKSKVEANYNRGFKLTETDSSIVLVSESYSLGVEAKELVKKGRVVLASSGYNTIRNAWDGTVGLANGKFRKAFIVEGNQRGATIVVELAKTAVLATAKAAVKTGNPAIDDIKFEIERIKNDEVRKKELDAIKVDDQIKALLKEKKDIISGKRSAELTEDEITAAVVAIFRAGSYDFKKWFAKAYGTDPYNLSDKDLPKLVRITQVGLNEMIWQLIIDQLTASEEFPLKSAGANCIQRLMTGLYRKEVGEIVDQQEAKAKERQAKTDERIIGLQQLLEEQKKPKKSEIITVAQAAKSNIKFIRHVKSYDKNHMILIGLLTSAGVLSKSDEKAVQVLTLDEVYKGCQLAFKKYAEWGDACPFKATQEDDSLTIFHYDKKTKVKLCSFELVKESAIGKGLRDLFLKKEVTSA